MSLSIKSELLEARDIIHGFSLRKVGDSGDELSVKPDELNNNDPDLAGKNRRLIIDDAGGDGLEITFVNKLPHGNTVYRAHAGNEDIEIDGYDIIVTNEPIVIGLSVADCVPILLYDTANNAAAVVHAGWRGTEARVVSEAIRYMDHHFGTNPEELIAVLGPSICGKCYEVDADVADLFPEDIKEKKGDKFLLDIRKENRRQLMLYGVTTIDDLNICNFENSDKFYSVRKENQTGRFMAFIAPHK